MESVVSEFEGTMLKNPDPFAYFMLVAFEASGLIRFTVLLLFWPIIYLLHKIGMGDAAHRLMVFVAVAGLRTSEIELVGQGVLPKFFMDDLDIDAWRVFRKFGRKVVVTMSPRIMVQWFAKEHLGADGVVGAELEVNRFGRATGFLLSMDDQSTAKQVKGVLRDDLPNLARLGRSKSPMLSSCKMKNLAPYDDKGKDDTDYQHLKPPPVIFHDGRFVMRPTPSTALLILAWLPIGAVLAFVRIIIGISVPMWMFPMIIPICGGELKIHGVPPPPVSRKDDHQTNSTGVLFVCTHRTLIDPVALSVVLQRKLTAVTYSISRLSEIISPIPTVRLSRNRQVDAERIRHELEKGDLVMCPEGTTCREPFLLRFSALFAELTDRIVPVGINYKVGLFHATSARGYKGMDPIFFMMNPRPVYEVTILDQLPTELTCSGGKSSHDVANYVQKILSAAMGYECTSLTRKDKYRVLAGNDGTVSTKTSCADYFVQMIKHSLR